MVPSSLRQAGVLTALAATAWLTPTRASAQTIAPVRLALVRGDGAESCASQQAVTEAVVARLGRNPMDPQAQRSIDVSITREGALWTARIYVRSEPDAAPAVRVLTSDASDCQQLVSSIELAVALAIDPDAPMHRTTPTPATAPATEPVRTTASQQQPAATPAPVVVPPVVPSPPSPAFWHDGNQLLLRGGVAIGTVPAPTLALQLGFDSRRWGIFRLTLAAMRTLASLTADGAFGFHLTALTVGGCAGLGNARVAGDLCAGLQLGITSAIVLATGAFEPVRPGDYPWLALPITLRGVLHVAGPLSLELGIEPWIALIRRRFTLEGGDRVLFEQLPAALNIWLGTRLRFQ